MSYDVNPTQGDLATARATVEGVLDAAAERVSVEWTVSVGLCWSDDPVVVEELGGASGVCLDPERIELVFTSRADAWTDALAAMAVRQYGRAWVRSGFPDEVCVFWWQELLEAAAGEVLATELTPEYAPPWGEIGRDTLQSLWPTVRSGLDRVRDDPLVEEAAASLSTEPPVDGDVLARFLPEAYAAVLATELGSNRGFEAFPGAQHSDVAAALDRALE